MLTHEQIKKRLLPPIGKVKVVLDTDAYNEVDDQFEIAWALTRPDRLDIQAMYAAPFLNARCKDVEDGMVRSYKEIHKIMEKAGMPNKYPVYKGSTHFLKDANIPVESEAVDDLIARAHQMPDDEPLYVVATGAITNVASALMKDPSIADKIVVIWLGGQPLYWTTTFEFNLSQDIIGVKHVLDSGVPFVLIPTMSVASTLTTTNSELNHYLSDTSAIGAYLRDIVTKFSDDEEKGITSEDGAGGFGDLTQEESPYLRDLCDYNLSDYPKVGHAVARSKVIWDLAAVAFLINPLWTRSLLFSAPRLNDNETWELTTDRHPIRVVMHLDRDGIFGDLFQKISELPK